LIIIFIIKTGWGLNDKRSKNPKNRNILSVGFDLLLPSNQESIDYF